MPAPTIKTRISGPPPWLDQWFDHQYNTANPPRP